MQQGWTLAGLLADLAPVPAAWDVPVAGLALDSRRVEPGDLFFACAGQRHHGLEHVAQAIARGAAAVVWEPDARHPSASVNADAPFIAVPGLRAQVGVVADRFYDHPSRAMKMVGITGTDGKTSVSQFLAQALDEDGDRCGVLGTLGYGLYGALKPGTHTTPDPIDLHRMLSGFRDAGVRRVVMEVSSHALDQGRVSGVAFDVGVFTNVTRDHLDYHGSEEAYAASKLRLFQWPGLEAAIVNLDDPFALRIAESVRDDVDLLGYTLVGCTLPGIETLSARAIEYLPDGLCFALTTPWGDGRMQTSLLGHFNVANLLATLGVMLELGFELSDAVERLTHTRTVPGRMERLRVHGRPAVVIDYAHTPMALQQVLGSLREHCAGRLWCVFGAGGDRDRGKRPLMAAAAERHADRVVVTSDNPRHEDPEAIIDEIMSGFRDASPVLRESDRAAAIALAVNAAAPEDLVLVAGKGHEAVQIVGDEQRPFSDRALVRTLLGGAA
jgi:UDP-N-acetylmuramoyl-L-alanyl-D-glutamate--2,6-diaminopimelate ligase